MSIYTSLSGIMVHMLRQDVTANNIANINTTGFKSSRAETQENHGLTGAHTSATSRSNAQGAFLQTSRNMDMAVEGRGFFPLKTPNGETAYTRDGTFHVDSQGRIVSSNGYRLDADITVPSSAQSLRIGPDGNVFAISNGNSQHIGRIEMANFFNPQGLAGAGGNLYRQTAASGPAVLGYPGQNGFGTVLSGSLETSNVSIVKEMTDMIINQRGMEVNLKATQTQDRLLGMLLDLKK
jgi:flagellar basal-body rod protein FlgG